MARAGQDHSLMEAATIDWWENFEVQVRLLRSHLLSVESDNHLERDLKILLSLYLTKTTPPVVTLRGNEVQYMPGGQCHTILGAAFMWLGGWRPTSVINLVQSVLGLEYENKENHSLISDEPQSLSVPQLSAKQLHILKTLQVHTQQAEEDLSNRLAILQMLIADKPMMMAFRADNWLAGIEVLNVKIAELRQLMMRAMKLRRETVEKLFYILNPRQAAKCSITAFELMFVVRNLKRHLILDSRLSPATLLANPVSVNTESTANSVPCSNLVITESNEHQEDNKSQEVR